MGAPIGFVLMPMGFDVSESSSDEDIYIPRWYSIPVVSAVI